MTKNTVDVSALLAERRAAKKRQQRASDAVAADTSRSTKLALHDTLKPYQREAVMLITSAYRRNKTGGILDATTVGLGKTYHAAGFLSEVKPLYTLWVTAKTLIPQTVKKLNELGLSAVPVTPATFESTASIYYNLKVPMIFITNYEALRKDCFANFPQWDVVVMDEVSKLKNGASYSPPALYEASKKFLQQHEPFKLFLSGTPSENHPREVWSYLHLFDPIRFRSLSQFERAFCNWQLNQELKLDMSRLLELLGSYCIRFTPKSVGIDLQPYNESVVPVDFSDSDVKLAYKRLIDEFNIWLDGQPDNLNVTMVLEQLLRQRQLLQTGKVFNYRKTIFNDLGLPVGKIDAKLEFDGPYPKLDAAEQLIVQLQAEGEQVVVFSCFNQPLKDLSERFSMFCRTAIISGETSHKVAEIQDQFQQGNIDILFINKLSGSKGLNLQKCDDWPGGASYVIHLDRWWNPAIEEQANARLLRINTNAPVFSYYLHVENTVDDFMQALLAAKDFMNNTLQEGVTVTKDWIREQLG